MWLMAVLFHIPAYLTCSTRRGLFSQSDSCWDLSSGFPRYFITRALRPLLLTLGSPEEKEEGSSPPTLEASSPEGSFLEGSFLEASGAGRLCWRGGDVLVEGGVGDGEGELFAVPIVGLEWIGNQISLEWSLYKTNKLYIGVWLHPLLAYHCGLAGSAVGDLGASFHCLCQDGHPAY